jgi:hypothetical protein
VVSKLKDELDYFVTDQELDKKEVNQIIIEKLVGANLTHRHDDLHRSIKRRHSLVHPQTGHLLFEPCKGDDCQDAYVENVMYRGKVYYRKIKGH